MVHVLVQQRAALMARKQKMVDTVIKILEKIESCEAALGDSDGPLKDNLGRMTNPGKDDSVGTLRTYYEEADEHEKTILTDNTSEMNGMCDKFREIVDKIYLMIDELDIEISALDAQISALSHS